MTDTLGNKDKRTNTCNFFEASDFSELLLVKEVSPTEVNGASSQVSMYGIVAREKHIVAKK